MAIRRLLGALALALLSAAPFETAAGQNSPNGQGVSGYSVNDFSRFLKLNSKALDLAAGANLQKKSLNTTLGQVLLRHPYGFDSQLKVPINKLLTQAYDAASKFVIANNFPAIFQESDFSWNIVVRDVMGLQIEGSKVSSEYCHTALMGPPADILIDGYRLFHPCRVTTSTPTPEHRLLRSIIHEVGHGVEYQLLGNAFSHRQRWHSEGFASWFESEAVEFLSGLQKGALKKQMLSDARASFGVNWRPYLFRGSPLDYSTTFSMISFIADNYGVSRLLEVYAEMSSSGASFVDAVERRLHISLEEWMRGTKAMLDSAEG